MSTEDTLYITTAIPFVNARPHLGFALELCVTDAIARHARARGVDVQLVSGTDDHSLKNVLAAQRAGRTTHEFVTEQAQLFRQLAAALEIRVDRFIQTSQSADHRAAVYALWRACEARGDLFQKKFAGLYCVGCERFVEPDEQRCPEHDAALEWVEETNWFFRLPRYAELIREKIESGELSLSNTGAREETLAFLREPLRDLCVSRSAERARGWGLPVPGDDTQVIWVWFDALAYYLSALRHAAADGGDIARYWESARRLHVIGKGVTRFHAVFWPAILASAGVALPHELLVHGYLTLDGAKISKSGRSLDPFPLIEQYGVDALRYYLLRHVRTGRDGDFSQERFIQAYNAELANGLGNLANRLLGLLQRATQGVLPDVCEQPPECATLHAQTLQLRSRVDQALRDRALDDGLEHIFELIHAANRCIDQTAPWSLIKNGQLESATRVLRCLFETLCAISVELAPFLPVTAQKLAQALHITQDGTLPENTTLTPSLTLFPRILDDTCDTA